MNIRQHGFVAALNSQPAAKTIFVDMNGKYESQYLTKIVNESSIKLR
jgi:hypothetical protein